MKSRLEIGVRLHFLEIGGNWGQTLLFAVTHAWATAKSEV